MMHENGHTDHDPKPLLSDPAVTILFDGLIYTAYNDKKRLYQAGIHTEATGHHLVVEVWSGGQRLFPSESLPWDRSHSAIKARTPFWLYVDTENGPPTMGDSNLELHNVGVGEAQSFKHILSLEELYGRELEVNKSRMAVFNFPHGICYSAMNEEVKLSEFEQGKDPSTATFLRNVTVSSLGAIDIARRQTGVEASIVLASVRLPREEFHFEAANREFFRFPLSAGKHYVIKIMNVPINMTDPYDPNEHFLQFYNLFQLEKGEKKFLVEPVKKVLSPPHSNPCSNLRGNLTGGLGM